ncbi:MAG TPA: universal stress protein [Chroococcales cyanobacterium]
MPFKKVLVPVDGSLYSQIALDYGIWLSKTCHAELTATHVIDPRLIDLFLAPQFGEQLGFKASVQASEKVLAAFQTIGRTILDLARAEGGNQVEIQTCLDVGTVAEAIASRSDAYDLVVVGHRGKDAAKTAGSALVGSVAERVAILSKRSVLVAAIPAADVEEFAVAFDGSEPARGALLLAEQLSKQTQKRLTVITVARSSEPEDIAEADAVSEQGKALLREKSVQPAFLVLHGTPASSIIGYTNGMRAILVLGAYGFRTPEENVLGSTTTGVLRRSSTSVLIYRSAS